MNYCFTLFDDENYFEVLFDFIGFKKYSILKDSKML
jgi:hypothetical protein